MISIPFIGSKRGWVKEVSEIVKKGKYKTIAEPFGGSGVLSVNLINDKVVEKAAINDYDGTFDIYEEYLDIKEELVAKMMDRGVLKSKAKLKGADIEFLQREVEKIDKKFHGLLSNNFVFSAAATQGAGVKDFRYFMNVTSTTKQREYLSIVNTIQRERLDYKDFINNIDAELLIIDPPYMNSSQTSYCNETFFDIAETVELLTNLKKLNVDVLMFNSSKKNMLAILKLLEVRECEVFSKTLGIAGGHTREDAMFYIKF